MAPHPVTHERAAAVFGFLADFGRRYPHLCEGDRTIYRDLCRAALLAIREDEWCQEAALGAAVEKVMDQVVRGQALVDVGRQALARLRKAGVAFPWNGQKWTVQPPRRGISRELRNFLTRYRLEIKAALADEALAG